MEKRHQPARRRVATRRLAHSSYRLRSGQGVGQRDRVCAGRIAPQVRQSVGLRAALVRRAGPGSDRLAPALVIVPLMKAEPVAVQVSPVTGIVVPGASKWVLSEITVRQNVRRSRNPRLGRNIDRRHRNRRGTNPDPCPGSSSGPPTVSRARLVTVTVAVTSCVASVVCACAEVEHIRIAAAAAALHTAFFMSLPLQFSSAPCGSWHAFVDPLRDPPACRPTAGSLLGGNGRWANGQRAMAKTRTSCPLPICPLPIVLPSHLSLTFKPALYVRAPEPPPPTHSNRRQVAFANQPVDRPGSDPQIKQHFAGRHELPTRISTYCHIKALKCPH